MVQNLMAYFILYVIAIQLITCVQEKIEISSMSQRPRLSLSIISGHISGATMIMQKHENYKTLAMGDKKLASCFLGLAFAAPCHHMATGLVQSLVI